MKTTKYLLFILFAIGFIACSTDRESNEETNSDETYFPPIGSSTWETTSIQDLNWKQEKLQALIDFLQEKNTKSFIVLHKGKIVLEEYMNTHDASKVWYWASAGKTLTTAVTGIAQEEGLININNKVSDYLGNGWTSAPLAKENLITVKNLLTMTSGLDDTLGDDVSPSNLRYVADAGNRWAYAPVYVKLQDIISEKSNIAWNTYFNSKLRDKIGMTGNWITLGELSVYWSNTRSMARFGLLISADGKWENQQIIPKDFLNEALNTSQNINQAYGYLWWLNGKSSYRLPQAQFQFNGSLIPNAPADMYAALGKNDQKIYVVPSKELVVIRMGDAGDDVNFGLSNFDNDLWARINDLIE
jgi:CubicO group peptidase (beta-lactamase class C family)